VALLIALVLFAVLIGLRYLPIARGAASIVTATALWVALFESGVDPVISGLAVGLVTSAYPPARGDLERATELTRSFREQPTPELARSAQQGLQSAISANERMQYALHPWVSYIVLPLFALANAGLHVTGGLLESAASSPVTLGILVAYVIGKPVGIFAGSWLATRPSRGPRPLVSGPVLAAGGACAGIGFTVSLLISSLAFRGQRLEEAKLGALATVLLAPLLSFAALRMIRLIPSGTRARQIGQTALDIPDLAEDDAARVRRLRVPLLRAGRAGDPRAAPVGRQ
jgi:Na+/H+ antiporter NhaA